LVTVNPDLFSVIRDHYRLADNFDAVVTSWEEGTRDKTALCHRALEMLAVEDPGHTVLIDNMAENVQGWREEGGGGYLFRGDEAFGRDVRAGVIQGIAAADLAE
jgi:FMN phosphatase YigB (HAD superfamily)